MKNKEEILRQLELLGIVPVIKIEDAQDAVPLCRALAEGGLPVAEITFRTAAAEQAIRNVAEQLPGVLVGAGTILSVQQAQSALDAGAQYIVTPGFSPDVVRLCVEKKVPVFPGCPTTSDIEAALRMGLEVVKFFPVEAMGGLKTLQAISAPYGGIRFIPTGGVDEENMPDYLSFPRVFAVGGSWMVLEDWIRERAWDRVRDATQSAVSNMLGFELAHVGINMPGEPEAVQTADMFGALFGWPVRVGSSSVFAGTAIEVMKTPGRGKKGHIAIRTNFLARAVAYLERHGFAVEEDSAAVKNGRMTAVYLKGEVGGFAVHLLQK